MDDPTIFKCLLKSIKGNVSVSSLLCDIIRLIVANSLLNLTWLIIEMDLI